MTENALIRYLQSLNDEAVESQFPDYNLVGVIMQEHKMF